LLQNVQVGSKITCVLSCQREVSKTVLDFLQCRVVYNSKLVDIDVDSSRLKFKFSLLFDGEYRITVQLYGQHILGSPLTLPVAASALPGLLKLGLIPHENENKGGESVESSLYEGSECVAKWTEDKVWYRARVDKVEGEMLEVTFYDYGNKEMVVKRDVVRTALDIPKGEDIDEFVVEVKDEIPALNTNCFGFSVGDVIIAKWAEDDVWYNGEIIKINGDEGKTVEVCFTDYGNTAEVEMVNIVKTKKEIPIKDEVDENVGETAEGGNGAERNDGLKKVVDNVKIDVDKIVETIGTDFKSLPHDVGSTVVAKWTEDEVWYNAEVESITEEGYTVVFIDYGNSAIVQQGHVLKSAQDIPKEDCIDECVAIANADLKSSVPDTKVEDNTMSDVNETIGTICTDTDVKSVPHVVGSTVVAKWLEDEVWYNAEVESITEEGYTVLFVDYGNSAIVQPGHILKSAQDIPEDDCIDECVAMANGDVKSSVPETKVEDKMKNEDDEAVGTNEECVPIADGDSKSSIPEALRWSEGCTCIAQWLEDSVWYNAVVTSDLGSGQYEVTFTDYGNKAVVTADKIVATASDIPSDQVEMIDECVNNNQIVVTKEELEQDQNSLARVDDFPKPDATGDLHNDDASNVSVQMTTADTNSLIETESPLRSSSPTNPPDGTIKCIACWSEDNVWYNASIEREEAPGVYLVIFTDYGNQESVTADRILYSANEIPVDQRDMLDENVNVLSGEISCTIVTQGKVSSRVVSPKKQQHTVGMSVIARWDEDGVWYNAVIENISVDGRIQVIFIDYGNTAVVSRENIVGDARDIPEDQTEMIDECVRTTLAEVSSDEKSLETHHNQKDKAEIIISKESSSVVPLFRVGSKVIARWTEDDVWYNAVVEDIDITNDKVDVLFTDYGNPATLPSSNIVTSAGEIPADQIEMIDECVIIPKNVPGNVKKDITAGSHNDLVGKTVIARWSEDGVWYNALVDSVDDATEEAAVTFIDYGNTATVSVKHILNTIDEIAADEQEMVDQFVHQVCACDMKPAALATIREEEDVVHPPEIVIQADPNLSTQCWAPGDLCIARWDEDTVWYNAEVLEVCGSKYLVRFTDYGNETEVSIDAMVSKVKDIPNDDVIDECVVDANDCEETGDDATVPPSLQCSLCGGLCRRGMRLVCSNTGTCWGCAVKEINFTRTCWKCGEKDISTETHLVKDMMLSSFVEEFVKTGKLDPAHVHALKNTILQEASQEEDLEQVTNSDAAEPKVKTKVVPSSPNKNLDVGTVCIARWSDDNVWYNALVEEVKPGSVRVVFTDYGNSDEVKNAFVLTDPARLPYGADVDPYVKVQLGTKDSTSSASSVEFLKNMKNVNTDGVGELEARQIMAIEDLKGPVGLAMLRDKTLAVVCKGDDTVRRFSMEGKYQGTVRGQREFVKPTDILLLRSGEFVIRDELGIQMFGEQGNFLKQLGKEFINRYFGLAEDDHGRVVTINSNTGVGCGKLTEFGETDLFYIDTTSGSVVKRVELIDIVGDGKAKSACRFLACVNRKLYIVDMGLDCVYVLFQKDGEEQADVFGSSGSSCGQFKDPAGLVVDKDDTLIIVDSKNNRLQLVDKEYTFCGDVKVDSPLLRPSGIFWYSDERKIFVSNYAKQSVVCYQI